MWLLWKSLDMTVVYFKAQSEWQADVDWLADVMERDEWTEMHAVLKFVH